MKFFETSQENIDFVSNWIDNNISLYGTSYTIFSCDKNKDIITVKKSSCETEFVSNKEAFVQIIVFEKAWDLLNDDAKICLLEKAFAGFYINPDTNAINVDNNSEKNICSLRASHKYSDEELLNHIESGLAAMEQAIELMKQEKQSKKSANDQN